MDQIVVLDDELSAWDDVMIELLDAILSEVCRRKVRRHVSLRVGIEMDNAFTIPCSRRFP